MKKPILLIGGGGHAKSIIDALLSGEEFDIVGILDQKEKIGEKLNGIDIIDTDENLSCYYNKGIRDAFITVGSVGIPYLRSKLYKQVQEIGFNLVNIIDPTAIIAKNISIGNGNFIGKGAILNADCRIGNGCIINTQSVIEHDCIIGDFVHVSPGSILCGGVQVGHHTHIGARSVIIEQKQIGNYTIIGAGSTVVKNIPDGLKAYGNPCVPMGKTR